MNHQLAPFVLAATIAIPAAATATSHAQGTQAVDLTTWTADSYPAVSGFGPGVWTVASDGLSVYQSIGGQPTMFYSDFNAFNTSFRGVARVETSSDNEVFGFVRKACRRPRDDVHE